ncbi:MAG: hypothetical protein WA609_06730 [Terriglobales bacterium]
MSLDWIWVMPNKVSAKRAIKVGGFVYGVLAFVGLTIASFLEKSSWRDFDMSLRGVVLELAVFWAIVAWRLTKNSRIFAVLGLLVTVYFYRDKFTSLPGAVLPALVVLALLNAVRAAFLYHKYEAVEKQHLPDAASL